MGLRAKLRRMSARGAVCAQRLLRPWTLLCSNPAPNPMHSQARNLYLMSHIAKEINDLEDEMKILFNRTMVMLGLCAFRKGLIYEVRSQGPAEAVRVRVRVRQWTWSWGLELARVLEVLFKRTVVMLGPLRLRKGLAR